jgi:DNA-binding HxlR family transcriptional regulator
MVKARGGPGWTKGARPVASWCDDAEAVCAVVSRKWVVPVLGALADGPRRHNDLQRAVGRGIHPTVLDDTLRHLESTGLVRRDLAAASPPHTWYQLTDLGKSLVAALAHVASWVEEHRAELAALGDWNLR